MPLAQNTALSHAVNQLLGGKLVAFPTETVYGLGVDANNPHAIAGLYQAKQRPENHPVIVHLAAHADPSAWSSAWPALATCLVEHFWPGPLTLIVPRARHVSSLLSGGQDAIGLRCPAHPVAQSLLSAFAQADIHPHSGIAAPSANRFGRISPTTAAHVRSEFSPEEVVIVDGGACPIGIESTIIDLTVERPTLLRPGNISREALANVLGELPELAQTIHTRASGTLTAHYAPRTPLVLIDAHALPKLTNAYDAVWTRTLALQNRYWRRAPADAVQYAQQLYATLREFDALGSHHDIERIVIETLPQEAAWIAINDRLRRAALGSCRT